MAALEMTQSGDSLAIYLPRYSLQPSKAPSSEHIHVLGVRLLDLSATTQYGGCTLVWVYNAGMI